MFLRLLIYFIVPFSFLSFFHSLILSVFLPSCLPSLFTRYTVLFLYFYACNAIFPLFITHCRRRGVDGMTAFCFSEYIQTCTDALMNTKIKGEFAAPYQFSHYSFYFKVSFLIRETKSVSVLPSKLCSFCIPHYTPLSWFDSHSALLSSPIVSSA